MTTNRSLSISEQVDSLFNQLNMRRGDRCRNPVTGIKFVWGIETISEQKLEACRALVARERHAHSSPKAPILPINVLEIDAMMSGGGEAHLLGYFAQSIALAGYNVSGHPPWETYARGVLASPYAPYVLRNDHTLIRKYPPRPMTGLSPFNLGWQPPPNHADTMLAYTGYLQDAEAGESAEADARPTTLDWYTSCHC
jgi:hypothetical protein